MDPKLLHLFYERAILKIKKTSQNPNLSITISDGFQKLTTWENFEIDLGIKGVFLDSHIYQVFDYNFSLNPQ